MARNHARIHVSAYDDDSHFIKLDIAAQGLYWMLVARRDINLCGVLPYKPRVWARKAAGMDESATQRLVSALEDDYYVVVDRDSDELWVRTFIFHDQVLSMPQVAMKMAGEFDSIDSPMIRACVVASLPPELRDEFPDGMKADRKKVTDMLQECDAATYKPPPIYPSDMGYDMGNLPVDNNPSCMGSDMGNGYPSGKGPGKGQGLGKGTPSAFHSVTAQDSLPGTRYAAGGSL